MPRPPVVAIPADAPRAQWAPPDCRCPWPWPSNNDHPAQDCPHHAPGGPVMFTTTPR